MADNESSAEQCVLAYRRKTLFNQLCYRWGFSVAKASELIWATIPDKQDEEKKDNASTT